MADRAEKRKTCKALDANIEASIVTIPSQRKHHTLAGSSHIVSKAVAQPWHSEGPSCEHLAAHGGQGGEKEDMQSP